MRVISADTETYLIGPDAIAPRMVCLSYSFRDNEGKIQNFLVGNGDDDLEATCRDLLQLGHMLVWHNAAFDLLVIATMFPDLEPLIWAKLEAGEIECTKIREQLINLSTHGNLTNLPLPDGSNVRLIYTLQQLCQDRLGLDLSADKEGDDIWRLNYHTLDGVKAAKYPAEASRYAMEDSEHTLLVHESQTDDIESEDEYASASTCAFHTAASFALFCMTQNGMALDKDRVEEVEQMLREELCAEKMAPLFESGILRAPIPSRPHANQMKKALTILEMDKPPEDWGPHLETLAEAGIKITAAKAATLNRKCLISRVEILSNLHGLEIKETAKGGVSTDSEVIEDLHDLDKKINPEHKMTPMQCYQHRQKLQKLVSTEIPGMKHEGEVADRIHFSFNPLVESGRTSSYGGKLFPSRNGQQIDPRVRPCYVADKGCVLYSVDYATLELAAVGHTLEGKYGYSVHADLIRSGMDLHSYLGSMLAARFDDDFKAALITNEITDRQDAYTFFKTLEESDEEFYSFWRGFAKPVGLGFPGGLGPATFIALAKKTYKVDIAAIALDRFEETPEEFDIECWTVQYHAKRLYGKPDEEGGWDGEWTPTLLAISLAKRLRDVWLETYPEMAQYFSDLSDGRKKGDDEEETKLAYTSPLGMHRAQCMYTAAANGEIMQTPAAEGAKVAIFNLVRETRDVTRESILFGTKVCNFIHDELMGNLPEDDMLHERTMRVAKVMQDSMLVILDRVPVRAEPALMYRWSKKAKDVRDDSGRIVPWKEPVQEQEQEAVA